MTDQAGRDLRAEIVRTLRPVTPLPAPGRRARVFLLVGVAALVCVPLAWGVRRDAPALGLTYLWFLSVGELLAAVLLFRHALAESIPGRSASGQRIALWLALGLLLVAAITAVTFAVSPTYVPVMRRARYLYTCSTRTVLLGVPALLLAGFLLRRGLTIRPVAAGAFAGLGAGLLADSSWRLYCEVSDPQHIVTAHAVGIVTLTLAGALAGFLVHLTQPLRNDPR